jgi:hypothetical protein
VIDTLSVPAGTIPLNPNRPVTDDPSLPLRSTMPSITALGFAVKRSVFVELGSGAFAGANALNPPESDVVAPPVKVNTVSGEQEKAGVV